MACNAAFTDTLELGCLQDGLEKIKAGDKINGVRSLTWAAGCGLGLVPHDKQKVGVEADPVLEAALSELEAVLPADGNVSALQAGMLIKLLMPVIQQILIKLIEGMDHT